MLRQESCDYLLAIASARVFGWLDWKYASLMEAKDTSTKMGELAGEDAVKSG